MINQVFDALREPVVVFDRSGVPLRLNRAAWTLLGLEPRPLTSQTFSEVVQAVRLRTTTGAPIELADLPSRRVVAGETTAEGTFVLTKPSGGDVYFEGVASRVLTEEKEVGVVVVLHDITAAWQAEARLERLNRMLRAHGRIKSAALHAADVTEYLRQVCLVLVNECRYQMVWVGLAEHDAARTLRPVAHAGFEQGSVATLNPTWADVERGRGPSGTCVRTAQVCESEDMLADPRFTLWRDEAMERGCRASIALPLITGGEVLGALTIYFRQPGRVSPEERELLTDLAGDVADGIGVLRLRRAEADAKEALRQQAEELAQADRAKDEFLSTLSHELRTPLSAILVWAHLLLTDKLDDEAHRRAEEAILRNAEAQRELINEILDVSRIVSGKLTLRRVGVSMRSVLDTALEVARPAAEAKGVTLCVDVVADADVEGDPGRLRQVTWNLLCNAVKFTPAGGDVSVTLDRDGDEVCIRVADTGIGISRDFMPHVFDRFTQRDSSPSREHGGLGLGLSIVRHLVELHGGTVTAESEGEGRGSVFTVRLPVLSPAPAGGNGVSPIEDRAEALRATAQAANALAGMRVLAVDDDPDARELFVTALSMFGAEVVVVGSAEEALEALQPGAFDVLVSDVGMPGTDGYSLIAAVRGLPGEVAAIPAIAVTAFGRKQDRNRALAAGYQAHLAKPVLPDQLAAAITWFVAQHRAAHSSPR